MQSGRKAKASKWLSVDDVLLFYRMSGTKYEPQYLPYSEEYKKRFTEKDARGYYYWDNIGTYSEERLQQLIKEDRIKFPKNPNAKPRMKNYLHEGKGILVDNIWTDIAPVNSQAIEDTCYATQKPEELIERVIKGSSNQTISSPTFLRQRRRARWRARWGGAGSCRTWAVLPFTPAASG